MDLGELGSIPALVERMQLILRFLALLTEQPWWPWAIPVIITLLAVWVLLRRKGT